jgi:small conductance mechanosensitive channel
MTDTTKKAAPVDLYTAAYNWALNFGPKLVIGILVFVIGLWVISFVKKRIRAHMTKKKVHSSLQPFFLSLSISSLYILLVIVVMEIMGIELTIFTAVIGAGGVAAGLALSGTLQNFAGGVLILLLKPFSIDDNIVAQGFDGFVTSIQVFYTVVLTHDNKTIIIPNGKLFNETIVNVSMEGKRRLDLEMKFNYGVDKDKVIGIIEKAITQSPDVLTDPAHKVGIIALEPDGFKLSIRVWIPTIKFTAVKFELHDKVLKDIVASGIKLPGMT